jgi:hypothetical protein
MPAAVDQAQATTPSPAATDQAQATTPGPIPTPAPETAVEAAPPEPDRTTRKEPTPRPEVLSGEVLPAKPKSVQPAEATEPATAVPSLRDFRERPAQAAELLALAAVAHYGPGAATTVHWLRESYPNASRDGIARAASHRFVRQARTRGIVASFAGPLAVLIDAGALNALHAELILNIAAAHGKDPTAPERAAELLYLMGVYDSTAAANTAVSSAIEPAAQSTSNGAPARLGRPLARTLTLSALRVGAGRVLRLIPGAGAVIGAVANARATDQMVTRAMRFYRSR